jgi:FkbM family methyltransferase
VQTDFVADLRSYIGDAAIDLEPQFVDDILLAWDVHLHDYAATYNVLSNNASRRCYLTIIAARMFWHLKKMPLMQQINFAANEPRVITDLSPFGYDIQLDIDPGSQYLTFAVEQYRYSSENVEISARSGDIVIDGGGYVGDSALYFSHKVGQEGRVYSFEFIPNNVSRWKENIARNPHLSSRINLMQNPIWSVSDHSLGFEDEGAASKVSTSDKASVFETLSIDDLVTRESLPRIDFIKLDIEGAEVEALHGAEEAIREFKPRLGVCLYHDSKHYSEIPLLLKEMNPGYDLYVRHMTGGLGETVLYAIDHATG